MMVLYNMMNNSGEKMEMVFKRYDPLNMKDRCADVCTDQHSATPLSEEVKENEAVKTKTGDDVNEENALLKSIMNMCCEKDTDIDVSDEIKELLKLYQNTEQQLKNVEMDKHNLMYFYMERYVLDRQEREKMSNKIVALKQKMKIEDEDEE